MKIVEFTAQKKTFNTVLLMWGTDPPGSSAKFKIYRTLNDADGYKKLAECDFTSFLDIDDLLNTNPNARYKVTAMGTFQETDIDTCGDPLSFEVASTHLFNLKEGKAGTKGFAFCKADIMNRCPECWSEQEQKVFKTNCSTCDGSGMIKGYKGPVELYLSYGGEETLTSYIDGLDRKKTVLRSWTGNVPTLQMGDIIVRNPTRRYIIDGPPVCKKMVSEDNKGEFIVKQNFILELLHKDHMAYNLEVSF